MQYAAHPTMPQDHEAAGLRKLARDAIADAGGGGRPRELATAFAKRERKLVRRLGASLALDALCNLFRGEMRRWSAVTEAFRRQLVLPGDAQHLLPDLRPTISVPQGHGEDPVFRPLVGDDPVTVGEARRGLNALDAGIAADIRKARAWRSLIEIAVKIGAPDGETLVSALGRAALEDAA